MSVFDVAFFPVSEGSEQAWHDEDFVRTEQVSPEVELITWQRIVAAARAISRHLSEGKVHGTCVMKCDHGVSVSLSGSAIHLSMERAPDNEEVALAFIDDLCASLEETTGQVAVLLHANEPLLKDGVQRAMAAKTRVESEVAEAVASLPTVPRWKIWKR